MTEEEIRKIINKLPRPKEFPEAFIHDNKQTKKESTDHDRRDI